MLELFHFLRPWFLLLAPAGLAIAWLWGKQADPKARWRGIIQPALLDHLLVGEPSGVRFTPIHWVAVSLVLAGVAAAGPTWEKEPPPFLEDRAPMVVALDLSPSMDAIDLPPTRLERAKQKIHDVAALRSGSRTGLVVYSGTAHLVLPPSEDPALLALFLEALDTKLMPVAGRHAADALAVADRILAVESVPGTVLFMTDGFNPSEIGTFAEHGQTSPHQVIVLAAGTAEGGPIRGDKGRMAVDRQGKPIQARLDREVFSRLSSEAGVPVASVTLDESDVEWVQRRAMHHMQVMQEKTAEVHWKEFGYYGTFPILLLAAFWFRKGWTVSWLMVLLLMVITGIVWPFELRAEPHSENSKFEYRNSKQLASSEKTTQGELAQSKSEARNAKQIRNQNLEMRNIEKGTSLHSDEPYATVSSDQSSSFGFRASIFEIMASWFMTPDQQGRWYFEHGDYVTAAGRYRDPMWKGLSYYRAGDYAAALAQFARLDSAEAMFLMGNCYARMKDYPAAVGAYDNALKGRQVFSEATENQKLVAGLIPKKPKDPEEGEADPNLDPDDIKFDEKGKKGKAGKVPQFKVKPEQMAEMWMRNLTISPADFLREKFRIEAEGKTKATRGSS
ncbi:putative Tetratricopeptide repeat protein [Nitrospira japonica]|uniref:Putative Tetratricopeptide repeat protein n=1 Tax=Nitrospira japonica TaxID=1325564 RepID=A0A1W1I7V4_9BACT|nr:VWA domain-containing protein [Nitrospira japonica]SLM49065.1 putative Tetratricopeptide repeat protein [Nitrospira japonica]